MGKWQVRLNDVQWQLAERDEYISALQKKIEELEELLEEKNERILYLGTKRFEPFLRSRLFDALLPTKSRDSRSTVCANTGLTGAQFERLWRDQFRISQTEGRTPVNKQDCYLYLRYCRTGVTAMQMQDDYQASVSNLNVRIKRTRKKLASTIGAEFTSLDHRDPDWLLEHSTPAWRAKFGAKYRHVCIVDLTFLRTTKSGNMFVSKKLYSHYKASWGVVLMRITALDGSVLLNGEVIPAAEPRGFANLDEKAWLHNRFSEKLVAWARQHQVEIFVAGDKAYGEFHISTLAPDAPVKFLVTGKKGQFGMRVKPAGRRPPSLRPGPVPHRPSRPKPAGGRPVPAGSATSKNYIYMPESEFRSARGKIENEFSVLKTWRRFVLHANARTVGALDQDSLVVAYCQNLRIADRIRRPA